MICDLFQEFLSRHMVNIQGFFEICVCYTQGGKEAGAGYKTRIANISSASFLPFLRCPFLCETPVVKSIPSLLQNIPLKRLAGNTFWLTVSELSSKGLMFIVTLYLARTLGVEGFGIFVAVQTIVNLAWLAVDMGTNMYAIREIARDKTGAPSLIRHILGIRLLSSLFFFSLYIVSIWLSFEDPRYFWTGLGYGFYLLVFAMGTDWAFRGMEKFRIISVANGLQGILLFVLVTVFVKSPDDLVLAGFLWPVAVLGAVILYILFLKREIRQLPWPAFDRNRFVRILRESWEFIFGGVASILYQNLPMLVISITFVSYQAGLFGAVFKILMMVITLGFYIPMAFYPVLSQQFVSNKSEFYHTVRFMRFILLGAGGLIALCITILADPIIYFLYGKAYASAVPLLQLGVWIIPVYLLRYSFGTPLSSIGQQRYVLLANMTALVSSLVVIFPLLSVWSLKGGFLSILLAEIFSCLVIVFYYRYHISHKICHATS